MTGLVFLFLVLIHVFAQSREVKRSEGLIRTMRGRYALSWYRTLTFEQETKQHDTSDRATSATWHEALSLPGRLRIEMDSTRERGVIFARDSHCIFREGKLAGARRSIHPLLLLGFDVYSLPVEETIAKAGTRLDPALFDPNRWGTVRWR
jgi:hypothetical protein